MSRSIYLVIPMLCLLITSCASLKINPPSPDKQTILVLPVLVTNQAERAGQHGFYYIYEIVNEDDPAITYEAVIKTPVKGDMLIIDTLPPGNYRVDKFIYKTVGSANFTYGQNVFSRNDKFKLESGKITIFSKSLNVRLFNKIAGRGGETTYSFDLYRVTWEQEEAILATLKTLPNFETWEMLSIEESSAGQDQEITQDLKASLIRYPLVAKEIANNEYDKDLLEQASTTAKGDPQKQIEIYIQLRSEQIESKNSATNKLSPGFDLTGTYRSNITGNVRFLSQDGRKPEVRLVQKGSKVTGSFGSRGGIIDGDMEGDTLKFRFQTSTGSTGWGKWNFNAESNQVTGTWESEYSWKGKWNLTRIE